MQAEFRYELILTVPHHQIELFRDLFGMLAVHGDSVKGKPVAYKQTSTGYVRRLELTDAMKEMVIDIYEQIKPNDAG